MASVSVEKAEGPEVEVRTTSEVEEARGGAPINGTNGTPPSASADWLHQYSLRSILRLYWVDWLGMLPILAIWLVVLLVHPYTRFIDAYLLLSFQYPIEADTVPNWALFPICFITPLVGIFIAFSIHRNKLDLHHAIMTLVFVILVTLLITDLAKTIIGAPRPDFFHRCFPNGTILANSTFLNAEFDSSGNVVCSGDPKTIREGHKSFFSGHASASAAGLGFLGLYIAGKLRIFAGRRTHVFGLFIALIPPLLAICVGLSRVSNYKHRAIDVFTGLVVGFFIATISYFHVYPPLTSPIGRFPYEPRHFAKPEDDFLPR